MESTKINSFKINFDLDPLPIVQAVKTSESSWLEFTSGKFWIECDDVTLFALKQRASPNLAALMSPSKYYPTDLVGEFFLEVLRVLPFSLESLPDVLLREWSHELMASLNTRCNDWFSVADSENKGSGLASVIYDDLIQWQLGRRLDLDTFLGSPKSWIWSDNNSVFWEWDARKCGGTYETSYAVFEIDKSCFADAVLLFGQDFLGQVYERLDFEQGRGVRWFREYEQGDMAAQTIAHLQLELRRAFVPIRTEWSRSLVALRNL